LRAGQGQRQSGLNGFLVANVAADNAAFAFKPGDLLGILLVELQAHPGTAAVLGDEFHPGVLKDIVKGHYVGLGRYIVDPFKLVYGGGRDLGRVGKTLARPIQKRPGGAALFTADHGPSITPGYLEGNRGP